MDIINLSLSEVGPLSKWRFECTPVANWPGAASSDFPSISSFRSCAPLDPSVYTPAHIFSAIDRCLPHPLLFVDCSIGFDHLTKLTCAGLQTYFSLD